MVSLMMDKIAAMRKYEEAKKEKKVDEDIISLLDKINSLENYYTTSSCSGRIGIMEIREIGDKKSAKFLGKWHREVNKEEVEEAISKYEKGYLYLLVQSSIFHVVAKDIPSAIFLINLSKECGFKYSSIKYINETGVLVEILSTENIQAPLGENGELKICPSDLEFFVKMANKTLHRVKQKLKNLEEKISSLLLSSSGSSSTL